MYNAMYNLKVTPKYMPVFIQTNADVLNMRVIKPQEPESVLLGSAMLAASAASTTSKKLEAVLEKMRGPGKVYKPRLELKEYFDKKYDVYKLMLKHQQEYKNVMKE